MNTFYNLIYIAFEPTDDELALEFLEYSKDCLFNMDVALSTFEVEEHCVALVF